jgi:hypothetical protein
MAAKLAIYVCPVPGCVTIAGKAGPCPKHPHKALTREIYEHRPRLDSPKPGDLGNTTRNPFSFGGFDSMGDVLDNLFGSDRPGGKS